MDGRRLKSAARSVLDYVIDGMIWTGVAFGMSGEVVTEINNYARLRAELANGLNGARVPVTSPPGAERVEWPDLMERAR